MRGKAESNCRQPARLRITPAYAGKRIRIPSGLSVMRDHPRLCGEKLVLSLRDPELCGSPPPMRGKVTSMV